MFKLRLKEIREAKGLSQKQLANALDISQGSVGNWESGTREPNFVMLKKIACFFNVTTDYLLGREEKSSDLRLDGIDTAMYDELHDLTYSEKEEILSFINFTKAKREDKKN